MDSLSYVRIRFYSNYQAFCVSSDYCWIRIVPIPATVMTLVPVLVHSFHEMTYDHFGPFFTRNNVSRVTFECSISLRGSNVYSNKNQLGLNYKINKY